MVDMAVHLGREVAARRLVKVADRSIVDCYKSLTMKLMV